MTDGDTAPWLRYAPHVAVGSVGYTMFAYASVPGYYVGAFDVGYTAFGLLMSATLLPFVLVQFPAGRSLGRHTATRLLLAATGGHAVLAVALDLVSTFPALLALRFLWGVTAGLVVTVGATHVARTHSGVAASRQQGIYGGMLTLGGAVGFLAAPALVGTPDAIGIHAVGGVLALPALAVLWVARDDRTTAPLAADDWTASPLSTVTDRTVLLASLCYVAIISSYMTLSTFVTGYFEDLGITGPLNAVVMTTAFVGRAVGGDSVTRLPVGDAGLIAGGTGLAVLGFAALALGPPATALAALPVVVMLAVSVPFGAVYNVAATATSHEGVALATVIAVGNVAALVLPAVTGAIRDATGGYRGAFVLLGVLNGLAVTGAFALAGRDRGSTVDGREYA